MATRGVYTGCRGTGLTRPFIVPGSLHASMIYLWEFCEPLHVPPWGGCWAGNGSEVPGEFKEHCGYWCCCSHVDSLSVLVQWREKCKNYYSFYDLEIFKIHCLENNMNFAQLKHCTSCYQNLADKFAWCPILRSASFPSLLAVVHHLHHWHWVCGLQHDHPGHGQLHLLHPDRDAGSSRAAWSHHRDWCHTPHWPDGLPAGLDPRPKPLPHLLHHISSVGSVRCCVADTV